MFLFRQNYLRTVTTYDMPSQVILATESFLLTVAPCHRSSVASGTSTGAGKTSGRSPVYARASGWTPSPAPPAKLTVVGRRNVRTDGAWNSSLRGPYVLEN